MQTLRYFLFGFITLTIISNAQTVIPPGDVSGTWALGGSPFEIQGEIKVPDGLTLTIEPGVLVEFQGHYKFIVEGRLLAVGTETDTITFTINDTTGFSIPDTSLGGWHGIRFIYDWFSNDTSKLMFCKLQYGKAVGTDWWDRVGGAILVQDINNLIISNCLISNNYANASGGGIGLAWSSPRIEETTISNNSASNGGGISCSESDHVFLSDNLFKQNIARSGGGLSLHLSNLRVENCIFEENESTRNGGAILFTADTIYYGVRFQIEIKNSQFINNTALERGGGGVRINSWYVYTSAINAVIDKCDFTGNSADWSGGLSITGSIFNLSNSIFKGNSSVRFNGGLGVNQSIGTILNCLFASNVASSGGGDFDSGGVGIYRWSNIDIMNCTFADNSASFGAGLTVGPGSIATTTNCIFWGNNTDQIALDSLDGEGGTLAVNYCNVQGGEDSVNVIDSSLSTLNWEDKNIDADPIFVDPGNGEYNLQDTSPCIGTATDSVEVNGIMCYCPPFDIEGNQRPNPTGSFPDIGAYESELANPVGIEDNGTVHPTEYALYQNFPNPFNPSTKIRYQIPGLSFVTLKVYDVLGSEVVTLVNEEKPIGSYEVEFNATVLPSGIYFYKLQVYPANGGANKFTQVKKMLLLK